MKAESLYIQKLTYDENTGNEIIGLFPLEANPAIVSSYTYDAKRMGGAPTITATIYSSEPLQWKKEEFVEYNGDRYFASYTPNSTKDNTSRMWKSEITFTSRRELLDNTLFFDVVVDDVDTQNKDRYRSNQTKFTFGGTIHEFVARINSSMAYCGLYRPTEEYKGYYVVVDKGYGTDEVKEVSFEDQYLTDVLQLINTTFELDYYWDGNVCHVGKVQHDLTDTPIKYGSSDALISVSKENANYKIVDMITGYGSSDNLPYYYPNDDEFGEAVFNTENISKDKVSVDLSKFLKGLKYNDVLVLYKSKYGQKYSASIDSSLFGLTSNTEPENLTLADSQTNPTVTCSFGFSFYVKLIKGQILDFTKLSFKFGMLDSLTHKNNITEITAAYKDIYLSNGNDIITITKKTVFGDNCKYPCENDGEYKLTIWAEFSYRCRVFRNGNGVTDYYGANSWNASFIGNIELLYEPTSEYEWKNGDKYIPYGESGINVSEIGEANCIEYDYQFVKDGDRYGFNKVYTGTEDNAVKVIVTDRVWIAPSSVLMPSIYRNTKGAERFYYALNNTHKLPSGNGYYEFVNLYKKGNPHQGTVTFDDIKPTINGIVNAEGQLFGEIADVAFDKEDSDVKDSDGKYIHNYFYIKPHKFNGDFGFDLFAHALASESAKINLIKSNGCPACSFTIDCYWNSTKNKCYNNVLTDGNGNLRSDSGKMNSKGDYILNDTYVEDNKSNQDSTKEELWIAVQKDTSTLGIVMPNASAGFKPQKGDLFVITGIKPPKVLVTAAEKRLDDALIKHMSENNTDQFNYSVKFSRIFLQENPDFASKLNENAKLSIQIQGDYDNDGNLISHKVFISNYSVKVDNDELAEVEIELVNSLEVTKSDTKQIIDAVKGEAVKSLSSIVGSSNANSLNASIADKMYLSKLNDDTAKGTITWEKIQKLLSGLLVGNSNSENGGSWTPDTEGRSHLVTDYLEVRMKAIFEELVIKKTSTIGGKEIISPAGGVVAHKVEEVTVTYNNVSQKAYRCYFLAEQEGDAVDNDFAIGDQVRSESFNVRKGTYHKVGNHFYWRLVIGRDEEPVELEGKKYHYIDLSDTDCATASDVPAKGDVLSQCGNRTDVERQNCLIFSAVDTYSPSISLYHGINSYSFANREYVQYGVNKQTNKAFFNVYGDMYVGDRPTKENGYEGSSYIKYDSAAKQVTIKGKLSAKSTVDGKELSQYIKENSAGGLTEEQVNNLIKNSKVIADLQNQVDGAIETWFYEGVPTLTNAPASSWTSDKDKDTHLGDLYYDNKTGKAYRFAKDGNTYKWTIIADTDIAKALSDASKAQETADGKMKVFSTQPIPPYQLGDIWVNATYPTDGSIYKNEILRCQTAKAKGSSFDIADWTKASKYTDDSALNTFKEEYKNDMASYKEQLDEKVETWFYNYAPTTQNKPASDWTTDTLKSQHSGDLFYNTSNGYTYRWTGTAWARIKDNDINTAMTAASKAQDTADGKRTVFTSQPTVPYDEGDLWASGGDDGKTLMVCIKSRTTGSFTSSEWVKANDSDLNAFAKTIEESLTGIQDQLDKKAETWYQSTDPSTSWTTDDAKKKHKGDLWYNTSNNQTFFWNGTKWDKQDVPTEVFDKIDGKSSIYVSKPASYEERDLWILEASYTLGGVAYSKGELVVATKTNASFSAADWTKKVKYTDDTVANAAKAAAEKAQKAAETAQTNVTNLGKTVTSNKNAFDSYVSDGYLEPSEIAAMAQDSKRLEDAFAAAEKSYTEVKGAEVLKNTKELTDLNTAFTTLTTAKTELVTYLSDISARYNAANTEKKATIVSAVGTKFTNFQSAYSAFYDKLGLANAYITSKIYGDLKQNITDLAGYKYIKDALGQTTDIDGGLVMTTLLALRDADGNVQSGINGAIDTNRGKKSIATWWGGQMVDKDYNSGSLTPATSLVRFDGSGYLANGAIWWDVDGKVHADPTSFIISEKNLGAYLAFFEPTWKSGSNGTNIKDLVALTPQAPFTTLSVSNDLLVEGKLKIGSITLSVVNGALKIDGNVYSTGGMSAYGEGTSNGGGLNGSIVPFDKAKFLTAQNEGTEIASAWSIKKLYDMINSIDVTGQLADYLKKTEASTLYQPKGNYLTSHQDISGKSDKTHTHSVKINGVTKTIAATGGTAVDLGTYLTSHQSLAAYLKSADAEKTYSKLGHTHAFSEITGKPTTLAGYGVTDGVNAVSVTGNGNAVTSASIDGHTLTLTKGSTFSLSGHTHTFASLTSKPTTIAGYGITDAYTKAQVDSTIAKYLPLAGGTITGALTVNGIATFKSKVAIGDIYIINDGSGNLYVQKTDGKTAANFYATGGITAYGAGTSTSGGGGLNASVISYARIIEGSYTDADLTSIPNAYAIKALSSRIDNIATELGGLSLSWNNITGKPSTFAPSAHTHKWAEITDRITKVSQLTNDAGYLTAHQSLASYYTKAEIDAKGYTTNKGTVTSVGLTLPAGLTCATKTITTSGTFAISLASGYSIPTTAKQTAWDGAVSAKHTHSNKSVLDGISSTKVSHWDSAYGWYALMTTDEETADGIINKWNEVVSFLANIAQTDTLSGIVDGINKSISDEVTRAKKAEGVNASGISANKGSIATLQGYFTNGSAKKALQLTNARKLWGNSFNGTADINGSIIVPSGKYISIGNIKLEYDAANKALKITNTTTEEVANLYTSGGVSAYGVGASSSSGGGLNGSVKAYADAIRLTTENLSEIASAYSVAKLYSEIQNVASAVPSISVSVPTGGNALTGATYDASTGVITFAKGTFLTAHQSLDGYVNAIAVSGSGNAVTAVTKSGKTITFTKGATYLTSHQSLSNYYTKSSVDSLLNGKSATTHTHSVKINGITKTIAASGGDAVDLGTYLTTHQSLAAYATQNWVKNEATAHNADMVDNYHASGLFTGFSISDVANKVTISIGGTSKALNLVRAFPSGVGHNFNDIATHGNSMGMSYIAAPYASSTANYQTLNGYVNPNGQTGWHHYINLSYTDSNNTATSPNMWQTQFAIKAGTTEVYVRSRDGGKISNSDAWAAPWVRLARVTDNVASASKVANALSWSGYSSGSYNGSAAKSISIPNNTNQLTNGAGFITASASISGNAGSATKLQNSRTINGTSFNGTANIVTSCWGTTRKLWGNSVNGNADVNGSITIANTDGVYVQIGDVRLVYDKANTAIKVVKSDGTTAANFYATGGITAYGEGSGSSGGGGLNGSVKSYADALKLASESLSEIASAYSIKQLSTRITSLEGGSATAISVSGGGNAVTSVTKNGTTISVVKGSTFLTAHQSLAGYMKTATADAKYMYHSRNNIVSDLNSFATNSAAHIYEMYKVTNRPNSNSWVQVMNWGTGDSAYGFLLANDYSTNGHMYFRQKIADSWKDWKTIIDSSNIGSQSVNYAASAGSVAWTNVSGRPSTMKNPSALSWSGYSSGSYDGSAAKSISIPNNTNQLTNGAGFITASASITGNAATATKVNHSLSVFGKSFNGSADVTVADTDLIASISTGTSNLTDKTEILTSYASDNGFNDSNAKNKIHRRPASAIWGYINSKTISNADKLDNVHLNGIFTALSNTNNGVSMTIGTVAKSLANMQVYSATKLVTARNIALGHDFRGSANFDGSGNITINGHINSASINLSSTDPNPFKRIAHVQTANSWNDNALLLYLSQGYVGGNVGICRVEFRTNNVTETGSASVNVRWLVRYGYVSDSVQVGYYSAKGNSYMDVFVKTTGGYQGTVIRCLQDSRGGINSNVSLFAATQTTEAYTSIEAAAKALYNLAYTSIVKGSDVGTVNYANSAGNSDTLDGIHANGLFTNLSNSGNNLSITIGGTNKTLTVKYAASAGNADTLDGVHASGLFTNLSNSGNNISITIGGTNKTLTAAYATNCDTVDGYHAQLGSSKPYGKIPVIGTDGVIELGHYINFHHDNTTGSDYSVRLQTNGNHSNVVTLPTATGTLALTSDNVASATKLQTTRTLWGQSFNGTANISGSMTGVGDMTLDAGARIKHGSGNLYIGNSDNSNWIGVQDICSQSSIGDGNWSLRTSGAAHFKDTTINGTATIKNLLSLVDGSHKGLKMGSTYISSLDGEVILQGNTALRFGNDAWDYDQWAGLKYDHSIKTVYLGIADGSIFKANSAQSGGVINLKQGISSVYTPALYAGGDIYHTGVYRMLWKNSKASTYLNVMNISQDDNGILTIGYGNFSHNKNVVLEGYNLNFRVGNDSGMKSMWLQYNNGNPVLSLDGNFYATGGVTAYKSSDERLKHDIHGVDSLAIIKAMGGTVAFRYNADNKDSIGWIAQRVLHNTFMQDLVEKDDKGFLKINYWSPKLIAVAFGAIEQVDDEVSRLKARVVFLESEVQRLSGKQGSSDKKRLDNKNINLLN